MSSDKKSADFALDLGDGDDVEILEVVGIDEVADEADPYHDADGGDADDEHDPDEIVLSLDDDGESYDLDADPGPPAQPAAEPAADDSGDRVALARLQADYDNLRKRLDRERRDFEGQANFSLVGRLLPVLDNFERALGTGQRAAGDEAVWQGVEMIYRQLVDELRREGLATIESVGTTFDPTIHDAVEIEGGGEEAASVVVEELQRGYHFRERLLRPAMVKVGFGQPVGCDDSEEG